MDVPEELLPTVREQREKLVERSAETMTRSWTSIWRAKRSRSEELQLALRRATLRGSWCRCSVGAALRNKGVQPVLDAVVDYLPSPLDVPPWSGH